ARLDAEEDLSVLDRLTVVDEDLAHDTGDVGLYLVHQLHGLDDAQHKAGLDAVTFAYVRRRVRRRRRVERTDDGRRHVDELLVLGRRLGRGLGRCLGGGRRLGGLRGRRGSSVLHAAGHRRRAVDLVAPEPQLDGELVLARLQGQLVDLGVLDHVEQAPYVLYLHAAQALPRYSPERVSTRTTSPCSMNSGTLTVAPDSSSAGLEPPETVSPLTPGSVLVIVSSTTLGRVTLSGLPWK